MNRNIKVETYLNNVLLFKNSTNCILEDNILKYNTDNDHIKINLNNFNFIKDNVESTMKLNKVRCTLFIKEFKKAMEIPIEYINYDYQNNKYIMIEYKLVSNEFPIKIIIEIGDINNEI